MKSAARFRLIRFTIAAMLLAILAGSAVKADDQALPANANKMCPVMTDQPTRADRFIDYNGKRIYFCCDKCMARFQQNPAKYIGNLNDKSGLTASASSAPTTQASLPAEAGSPGSPQRFHSPLWQLFGRFHVVIVHFPIALIILAGAIEFFRLRKTSPSDAARFCLTFGAIAAVMAACMGWVDAANQFGANPPKALTYHRWLGISFASVAIVVTALAYLVKSVHSQKLLRVYRFGTIFCAAGIGLVGHFGGMLTYGDDYFTAIFKTNSPTNSQPAAMPMASAVTPVAAATTQPSDDLQNALVFGTAEQVRQARIKIRLASAASEPNPPAVSSPTNNSIDQFIVAKWEAAKLPEAQHLPQLCDDATFVRRVYLDVIGMIPTIAESQQFMADQNPNKRAKLIDDLLGRNEDYAANLTPWFEEGIASTDVDQEGGVRLHGNYRPWIVASFKSNRPYDVMVAQLIDPTEPGYVKRNPVTVLGQQIPVGYVLNDTHKDALQTAANFGQFFLGTGMKCASCHSHFTNEEWPQARFTAFASMFCDRNLELIRCEKPTGKFADAAYPFKLPGAPTTLPSDVNERLHLVAELTTDPANPRFARTTVNRLWRRYLGLGLFEPIDDFRLDSPAANPELLDWLAYDFVQNGYDLKHTIRLILNSRTYQLKYNPKLEDHFDVAKREAPRYWRSPSLRKLTAEELIDSIKVATSQQDLPDAQRMYHQTESTDLSRSLGRPSSRQEIATARPDDVAVVQSLELMNGYEWSGMLYGSGIVHDMMYESDPVKVTQTFYEAALSRSAKPDEVTIGEEFLKSAPATQPAVLGEANHLPPRSFFAAGQRPVKNPAAALGDMLWALVSSPEFQYVH